LSIAFKVIFIYPSPILYPTLVNYPLNEYEPPPPPVYKCFLVIKSSPNAKDPPEYPPPLPE